ncbi:hypothetical protein ACFRAI_36885 [Streptomyces sp. NPDC056637]
MLQRRKSRHQRLDLVAGELATLLPVRAGASPVGEGRSERQKPI